MSSRSQSPYPAWLETAVFYQIYPPSFADSNGDGIGDLRGITGRLDYIASLGCNALWLNPIFPSPFRDGGYDVTDFCAVAPRYGTLQDARRLFAAARRRGIRVCLDLVAGHTSDEHPWFQKSQRASYTPYRDRYIWTDHVWQGFSEAAMIKGKSERDGAFLPNFFHFQPALNYGYAQPDPSRPWQQPTSAPGPRANRRVLQEIMRFWLAAGCSGFRVDMASSLVKDDPGARATLRLWQEVRRWMSRHDPEAVLISEWGHPTRAIQAGFHIDFLLHFGDADAYRHLCGPRVEPKEASPFGRGYFDRHGQGDIRPFLRSFSRELKAVEGRGFVALPTGNHDFARFLHGRKPIELPPFLTLLLTLPGVPFIFYGDEIGLPFDSRVGTKEGGYGRTGTRRPMRWNGTPGAGFSAAPAHRHYLPVGPRTLPHVAGAEADPRSSLHLVRRLLALRREHAALGNTGELKILKVQGRGHPFVFVRQGQGERFLVAINPTAQKRHYRGIRSEEWCLQLGSGVSVVRNCICCQPFAYGVWRAAS